MWSVSIPSPQPWPPLSASVPAGLPFWTLHGMESQWVAAWVWLGSLVFARVTHAVVCVAPPSLRHTGTGLPGHQHMGVGVTSTLHLGTSVCVSPGPFPWGTHLGCSRWPCRLNCVRSSQRVVHGSQPTGRRETPVSPRWANTRSFPLSAVWRFTAVRGGVGWCLTTGLVSISPVTSDVEQLFVGLLASASLLWRDVPLSPCPLFHQVSWACLTREGPELTDD